MKSLMIPIAFLFGISSCKKRKPTHANMAKARIILFQPG